MSPRWNWDSPTPLAASECALSQFQRLQKRLALCLLCGLLPWLVRWACRAGTNLCSALAALVGRVENIFFLTVHYFNCFVPIAQQEPCWVACTLACVSVDALAALRMRTAAIACKIGRRLAARRTPLLPGLAASLREAVPERQPSKISKIGDMRLAVTMVQFGILPLATKC
jgi:hypothetical protein